MPGAMSRHSSSSGIGAALEPPRKRRPQPGLDVEQLAQQFVVARLGQFEARRRAGRHGVTLGVSGIEDGHREVQSDVERGGIGELPLDEPTDADFLLYIGLLPMDVVAEVLPDGRRPARKPDHARRLLVVVHGSPLYVGCAS